MYGTLSDWRAYALARGDSAPTDATDADATAALVRASDYIRYQYVAYLLPGYDGTSEQVQEATYIAAGYELATPGFFSKTYTEADKKVLTEVKGLKWTVIGNTKSVRSYAPVSSLIEAIFDPITSDNSAPYFMMKAIG
ncbi:hypothetical protein [Pseudovibrio sp. SPO723]|uniref:hypothetical protein n=1 Tax=Nesiotobacter zosterae TaxID=392721 RepID=UPI0029C1572E|nr:hypothetical protein [Pseudovibrio sp. SPO723]MDX5592574.1 hypothetical protein [Pseudovibrio sp. SPO723]